MQKAEKLKLLEKKRIKGNFLADLINFLFALIIKIPLIIFILVPFNFLLSLKGTCKRRSKKIAQTSNVADIANDIIPKDKRKYDIVLFGVTGYTGQLCGTYLSKNYSLKNVKYALAGRSKSKLEEIKQKWSKVNKDLEALDLLVVDLANDEQIIQVVKNTKVVITTAGPFFMTGTKLLAQCVAYGTDYCDITGEVAWIRQMAEKYDDLAAKSGARIVNCCGCDSVPWDIGVFGTVKYLKEEFYNEEVTRIECFDDTKGMFSGGTLATLINSLENKQEKSKLGYDPLQKIPGKQEISKNKFIPKLQGIMISHSKLMKKWMGNFALAPGNCSIVRKSNYILNYGTQIVYYEGLMFPTFLYAFDAMINMIILGCCVFNSCIRKFLIGTVLPKQGQGPSEEAMNKNYLDLHIVVTGKSGTKVKGNLQYFEDPGYKETGRMLAESGLSFILNKDQIKCGGGFYTTASCFGDVLLNRLKTTGIGCEFTVETLKGQTKKKEE